MIDWCNRPCVTFIVYFIELLLIVYCIYLIGQHVSIKRLRCFHLALLHPCINLDIVYYQVTGLKHHFCPEAIWYQRLVYLHHLVHRNLYKFLVLFTAVYKCIVQSHRKQPTVVAARPLLKDPMLKWLHPKTSEG